MQLTYPNKNLLTDLKLKGILAAYEVHLKNAHQYKWGYEEFLGILLQEEIGFKKNSRVAILLKKACFKLQASLEAFDWSEPRNLERSLVQDLSTARFIEEGTNLIIQGPTGVGKSFVATGLGYAACRRGLSVRYFRMNDLIEQLTMARLKGSYSSLVKKISSSQLIILDDFGIKPLSPNQFQDFYDVIDERANGQSTIITTQVPTKNWSDVIADPVVCEAITDRLASKGLSIHMKGPSYRKKKKDRLTESS